jgi:O-antigen/teichoic acid export membrane protein
MVCHFFTIMFLARLLDEHAVGVYFIALMMTFLLKLMSDFGVDLAFVKQYPEENQRGKSSLLRSAIFIRLLSCSLVSLLYIAVEASGIIPFITDIAHLTTLTLALYWMHSFRELILRVLQAEQNFPVYAGTQVLAAVLKAVMILALALLPEIGVAHVLGVEIVAFIVSIIYASIRLRPQLSAAVQSPTKGGVELVRFGYPLYLNALLNLGNEKVSQYIVAGIGGPVAMAFFGFAERLSEAGTRLFEAFANVYLPAQTSHFANSASNKAAELANRSMLWIGAIIGGGIVLFAAIREPIMELLFTATYVSAANAAVMFFGVLLLRSLQTLMGYHGVAAGLKFLPIKVSAISSVFNIALCALLFSWYGYEGAIAALVFTQLLMNFLYYFGLRREGLRIQHTPIVLVLLICLACVCWVYWFDGSIAYALIAFPIFIGLCLLVVPELRSDLAIVFAMIRQKLNLGLPHGTTISDQPTESSK